MRTVARITERHKNWLYNQGKEKEQKRLVWSELTDKERKVFVDADLSGAVLSGAVLSGAVLSGAVLRRAVLSGAVLRRADLSGAVLRRADLSGADLRRAVLSGADLSGADLRRADLSGTCLSPNLLCFQREFTKACPPVGKHGGRIVYRTATSQHVGSTVYEPGHTYIASVLSFDCATDCHPGIYAASLSWMRDNYFGKSLVRCYVRDGDWVISGKGAIRCKRLRVLERVEC